MAHRLDLVASPAGATITVTTKAAPSSLLDQDHIDGLQLTIERCSRPWQAIAEDNSSRYHCPDRRLPVLAQRAVIVDSVALANLDAHHEVQHLLFSLTLPQTAGTAFQDLSSTIHYTLDLTGASAVGVE